MFSASRSHHNRKRRSGVGGRCRLCLHALEDRITPDALVNNNVGSSGGSFFTQANPTLVAFASTVVIAFNDSGSAASGANKLTGWARSTDGGNTFTDLGALPTNSGGDAGDPMLARDAATGRIYLATLGFNVATIQIFRSNDNGASWSAPVDGTPGGSSEDKERLAVDNFAGAGQGNVYLVSRRFGATGGGPGIYLFRSTDGGATFGPLNGVQITANAGNGAYVVVGPDHSVYVFWYEGAIIRMRKSIDQGVSFGSAVNVASGLIGGANGDLGLTGFRQGTLTAAGFRTNEFPDVAINPVTGHVYVAFDNHGSGADKADIFLTRSTDGGATWSTPSRVNDDSTTTDQWGPTLAVTPDGNSIGIFYYSRQENTAANNLFKFYGRLGKISGATVTFAPSFAVSSILSLPEFGRDTVVNSTFMSDHNQAVATPGAFHVAWSDNRDDLPGGSPRKDPNIYYNRIALPPLVANVVENGGEAQRSRLTSVTVTFSTQVTFAGTVAAAFQLSRIGGGSVGGFTATASVVGGVTSVALTSFVGAETQFGSLADGRYRLTVRANQVSAGGIPLDGNGDGTTGDDFVLNGSTSNGLFRLFGDSNGDGRADVFDYGLFSTSYNKTSGQAGFLAFFDFNGDGRVDIADLGQFSLRYLIPLP